MRVLIMVEGNRLANEFVFDSSDDVKEYIKKYILPEYHKDYVPFKLVSYTDWRANLK